MPSLCKEKSASRLRITLHGTVQGVGFRPFVYRLATEMNLGGWVLNSSSGLVVEVEGSSRDLETFSRSRRAFTMLSSTGFLKSRVRAR